MYGRAGAVDRKAEVELPELCAALIERESELLRATGSEKLTLDLLDDLALLTLGPQLEENNTRIGVIANRTIFEIIQQIVKHGTVKATASRIEILNASKRKVVIAFSTDPDISILKKWRLGNAMPLRLKSKEGQDASNIWNRLGEAEKSHQSAKQHGFVELLDPHLQRAKSQPQ